MPEKTTKSGRKYEVNGKSFTWHPLDDNDEAGNLPDVVMPLRIKLKTIRAMADRDLDDVSVMFDIMETVAPGQGDTLDEMDLNDFQECFYAWQQEYTALSGAAPGE